MAIKLAVLLSGNGTTLQNIIDRCASGGIDASVVCVLSSRAKAYGLQRAHDAGIPALSVPRKDFDSPESFGQAVWNAVGEYAPDLVALAGFMSLLPIPEAYHGRIMNVHPALIPAFSGQGMYGERVHQAVLDYGVKVTGVTVHFVNDEYDRGPVIAQSTVAVEEDDTVETLAARVQEEERDLYPKAIQLFAEGRLRIEDGHVRILI